MNKKFIFFTLLILGTATFWGCTKIKDAAEEAWDEAWEGVFDLGDGWQIELEGNEALFVTAGDERPGDFLTMEVGELFASDMYRVDDNTWKGVVRGNGGFGFMDWATAEIVGDKLVITPFNEPNSPYMLTRGVKQSSPPNNGGDNEGNDEDNDDGNGADGNGDGDSEPNVQTLADQLVEGKTYEEKTFKLTLSTGVKKLEIITTEPTSDYRNLADLFVRKGSRPVINRMPTYSWTADCAGVASNREDEVCSFTNPSPGEWYITLYGYNTNFISQLIVKATY